MRSHELDLTRSVAGGYTGAAMSAPRIPRRFMIVPARPRARSLLIALAGLWLFSLVVAWTWSATRAAPELRELRRESDSRQPRLDEALAELAGQRQRLATLERSDQISRRANAELQRTIAERDEEIAQLRADVAFYERLVGSTSQRRGLSVHSLRMVPGAGGIWHYAVTLTQNLNRGSTTRGTMTLEIEGVRDGRLVTLGWTELAAADAAAQPFAFRYFQQVEGSVLLPDGFGAQRIRVRLQADGRSSEQAFAWDAVTTNAGAPQGGS